MDQLVDDDAREGLIAKTRDTAFRLRDKGPEPELGDTTDSSVRSSAVTDNPIPTPPFWGVREIPVDLGEVYPHLDTHVLFKLHWGGRGVKGEAWRQLVEGTDEEEGFLPRLQRMWAEQDYLHPRAKLGYFPCRSGWQRARRLRPRGPRARARAPRVPAPAQARPHLHRRTSTDRWARPTRPAATSWRSRR